MDENSAPTSADNADPPAAADAGAVVRTFLIADVRGYTRFTQAHGDEEAGELAARFAALAREAVTATGGEVIELRGDEALCVFHSARQALRAAVELQVRFRNQVEGQPVFPLGIGIGLDAGEAVPVESGYRGAALNLAARLCSLAAPGQILASETVISLAQTFEGVRFVEHRKRLKGLEKPVRVIEVVPEAELPPVPAAPRPSARRRGLLLLAAGALVLTGTVTAAILTLTRDSDESVESIGNAIAAIDGDGGAVSYTEAGNTPSTIAVGEGAVWVLNAGDRTLSKIDPETRRIVKTFGTGGTTTDLAVGEGAVWVGNGGKTAETLGSASQSAYTTSVSRLDPDSTAVTGTRVLPGGQAPEAGGYSTSRILGVSQLAAGAGGVWAINPDLSVSRIDPDTLELVARIPVTAPSAIAAGSEGVWVTGGEAPLVQIDPRTNKVGQTIDLEVNGLAGLALGAGSVWATDLETGLLWRVEPGEDPSARTIDIGQGATAVAFGAGAVWVTNFVSDEVVRVDPDTNEVTARIPLAGTPPSVAAGAETAWVSIAGAPRGEVLPASVCGAVLGRTKKPDVLIASGLPLQGPSGEGVRIVADAVRFVLREHGFRAGRHTVGYQSCDDSTAQTGLYDFIRCASNAKAYVATARLVGVIGPFDSPCASAQIPITNRAEEPLAMISPSNTDAGLTHAHAGGGEDQPEVYYPSGVRNYVRVIGPVDFEAAAGAVLAQELGLRRVYVLRSPAGFDFVISPFRRAAGELGIAIAGSSTWADEAKTYDALAERIARARPDGIFIGGFLDPNAGALLKALRARLGPKIVLFTGEYTRPSDVLSEAPRAAIGIYISSSARAHESLGPAGQAFLREFAKTQPGGVVPSASGIAEAAQATEVLLQAIARSDGTRASVTRELRRVQVEDGILGSFQFDRNGDMTPASFTIFRITGGQRRDPDLVQSGFAGAVFDRVVRVPPALVEP
jgi:branched-chain amino acid transport system substrate-binding protein